MRCARLLVLLPLLAACTAGTGGAITPDACEGALVDERVNVPLECDELGYLIKEAGRVGGTEIILAAGSYFIEGDLVVKNGVILRGEDPGDPPWVQVTGEVKALNAVLQDVIIDGTLDAQQTELKRVYATKATIQDVIGSKLEFERLWVNGEVDLTDVTTHKKLEIEGWGRFTRVMGETGSAMILGDTTVNDSQLPEVTVRTDTESRDRVDVVIQETAIHGSLIAHGGTSGTVYVHLEDSSAHGVKVVNDVRATPVELQVLRSELQGAAPAVIDLVDADNFTLVVNNSLVHGGNKLLTTDSSGKGLAEEADIALHNNVFIGGNLFFEQSPQCGVVSQTQLSLRNNVFVDVNLRLTLLQDQDLEASHNLLVDTSCRTCETVAGDECTHDAPRVALDFEDTDGTRHVYDAGFVDLDTKDPGASDLTLAADSPAIDAGVPEWSDPDASRSDMGLYGGSDALP